RETYSGLRIIEKLSKNQNENVAWMIKENNELISILVTSIKTAQNNMNNSK
ncbi:MAG: four helix bundle protein, partial [Bacteroidetes bacterium]